MKLYKDCPECEGTGINQLSNCCGAMYDEDIRICTECKDNIGDNDCPTCKGECKILNHIDTKEDY